MRTVPIDDEVTLEASAATGHRGQRFVVEGAGGRGLGCRPPQQGEVTTADKITKEDLRLDWTAPAVQLRRVVRLGRAWTTFRGKRLTVLDAVPGPSQPETERHPPGALDGPSVATGGGTLVLRLVQPESRSPMSAEEWLRGVRPAVGELLGTD